MPPESFVIRSLRPDDNLRKLSLGDSAYTPLKIFLVKHAVSYEANALARTYVLVATEDAEKSGRVWGYFSLVASEVQTTSENRPADTHWPDAYHIPAVKLARMAIDTSIQRGGWGTQMLDFALALVSNHVASHIGCHLLVTDAKKNAVSFYSRQGFTLLDTDFNRESENPLMFIHLGKLKA